MTRREDQDASVWGDAVIAKRHVGSSYHIAVVTDDALQGVTHVVRGKDMEAATSLAQTAATPAGAADAALYTIMR